MITKFIEGFLAIPRHHQAMLNDFLERALAGDEEANQLTRDYAAGKMTKEELGEEKCRRYGNKGFDELLA